MNEILKQQEQQDQSSEGEGDSSEDEGDSSEDEGDSSEGEGDSSEGKPKKDGKSGKKPTLCDKSLLGEQVDNKTDKTLSEQQASESSKGDEDNSEICAKAPSGMCEMGKNVRVKQEPARDHSAYQSIVSQHRREIGAVRSSLMFRNTHAKMVSYGLRSGDIDENSLFKVCMDDDRVMTRTDAVNSKNIAICLLVDESGSMGCMEGGEHFYQQARNVAIVLAEGLKGMDGIDVCIYGHTAEDGFRGVTLREYYSPRQRNLASLMNIESRAENHDSWAILHTANLFKKDYGDHDRKIMFVISDGVPAGSRYGGSKAINHVLEVNRSCLKKGIEVYGVGIANAFSRETGEMMYGSDRCVILGDVKSSLGVMTRFIRQIANKQVAS
jgi:cobalamin biosynthesis protein CobT